MLVGDSTAATDGRGEVIVRGPNVMRGYLGKPDETARTLEGGWLHTGDVGYFDADGYLVLVDRVKDMIIRGGENIYPKEIENVLYGHPQVLEAAVVGRHHAVLGEEPVAFVALRDAGIGDSGGAARALLDVARSVQGAARRDQSSTPCPRTQSARSPSPSCASSSRQPDHGHVVPRIPLAPWSEATLVFVRWSSRSRTRWDSGSPR